MKSITQDQHHPAIYGIAFTLALVLPILGVLGGAVRFVDWYWNIADQTQQLWEIAFFTGSLWAAISAIYVDRLLRSRAIWWYAYYEAWLETLQYPKETDRGDYQ